MPERDIPIKGFIEPGPDVRTLFELTKEEKAHLEQLLIWQEQSARSHYILGGSIDCQHCHVSNNPNNNHCHQCGGMLRKN